MKLIDSTIVPPGMQLLSEIIISYNKYSCYETHPVYYSNTLTPERFRYLNNKYSIIRAEYLLAIDAQDVSALFK